MAHLCEIRINKYIFVYTTIVEFAGEIPSFVGLLSRYKKCAIKINIVTHVYKTAMVYIVYGEK